MCTVDSIAINAQGFWSVIESAREGIDILYLAKTFSPNSSVGMAEILCVAYLVGECRQDDLL